MASYKCAVVGNGGVGKTTWLLKFHTGNYMYNIAPTLAVEVTAVGYQDLCFNMWDLSGAPRMVWMAEGNYTGAHCGLICFDVSDYSSFVAVRTWADILRKYTGALVIVGLKAELKCVVPTTEIADVCKKYSAPYTAVSSAVGTAVEAPLRLLAASLVPPY